MKKIVTIFPSLIISLLFLAHPVSAHTLETSSGVGGVLHIDPDDSPIAGQNATFFLDLKDESNRFSTTNCMCSVKLYTGSTKLLEAPIVANPENPTQAQFSFVPPHKGVYRLELNGKPLQPGQFNEFQLLYTFRVERDSGGTTPPSYPVRKLFIPGVVTLLVILGGGFYFLRKRR